MGAAGLTTEGGQGLGTNDGSAGVYNMGAAG
eukprot:CAMPEP_0172012314 /NCGR_PEP_ID=MMETSP1041-20130122/8770_1 /TAXON_ID=464988 /ORGANISM="Hemiselmis andersenii, Strain CCMP439" /LENGTH=30 /DNA_ID= /DNA_START= /DNA_END= /DNA_ORIENTATION=